jgi:hypothetical protein
MVHKQETDVKLKKDRDPQKYLKRRTDIRYSQKIEEKHHDVRAHGRVEIMLYTFLTSALDGGECQLHAPATLTQGKEPPVTI